MSEPDALTNVGGVDDDAAARKKQELAENLAKLTEKGWTNPIPFNYETVNSGAAPEDVGRDEASWLGNAAIYEWDDEFGEVGPKNEKLEEMLYHGFNVMKAGNQIKALSFEVTVEDKRPVGQEKVAPVRDVSLHSHESCSRLTLYSSRMLVFIPSCLRTCSFVDITHQRQSRRTASRLSLLAMMWLESRRQVKSMHLTMRVLANRGSGSGKTAAYLIPILSKLMGKARMLAAPRPNPGRYNPMTDRVRAEPLVLIVCPTRELACQIFDEARRLCYRTMLRPCVMYGGAPTKNQREQLEMGCDILIATPGRLMDFMQKLDLLSLNRLK